MNAAIAKNYLTTLFGILAGLPAIVLGAGLSLDPKWTHILMVTAGIGTVGLGVVSKAFNNHSTAAEVDKATNTAAVSSALKSQQ